MATYAVIETQTLWDGIKARSQSLIFDPIAERQIAERIDFLRRVHEVGQLSDGFTLEFCKL